jgi:uncharacterized delta-60 repeat protein
MSRHMFRLVMPTLILAFTVAMTGTALAADGDLDTTFGGDGIVTTNLTERADSANAVAVQPDGKIVVAGEAAAGTTNSRYALARYNTDGTLDTTFGGDGLVTTNLSRYAEGAWGVAIQPDGKIVVAGDYALGSGNSAFAVVRYDAMGTLDVTFGGGDGKVVTQLTRRDDGLSGLLLQDDDRIVVSGGAAFFTNGMRFGIARYNSDGSLDATFGGDGTVTTSIADVSFANDVGIQPDGKILAGGFANSRGHDRFAVARYNADGTLDTSYSGDGKVITTVSGHGDAGLRLSLQPDGRLVVVGPAGTETSDAKFAAVRYDTEGAVDSSFDGDGRAIVNVTRSGDYAYGLALQADNKVVMVGFGGSAKGEIVRLDANGALDSTFSGDGKAITDLSSGPDFFIAVEVQSDGNIVAVGGAGSRFGVVRYVG